MLAHIGVQEIFAKRKKIIIKIHLFLDTFCILLCCFKLFSMSNIFSPSNRKLAFYMATYMFCNEAVNI